MVDQAGINGLVISDGQARHQRAGVPPFAIGARGNYSGIPSSWAGEVPAHSFPALISADTLKLGHAFATPGHSLCPRTTIAG